MKCQHSKNPLLGNPIKMKIGLCNPLAIPLKNAKIRIEAAKNLKPVTINCGTVKPKHKVGNHSYRY